MGKEETEELRRLVASRASYKGIITKADKFVSNPNSDLSDAELLKVKKDRLLSAFSHYAELNIEVQIMNPSDNEDFDRTDETFCSALANFNRAINKATSSGNECNHRSPGGHDSQFQNLPRIIIKTFNGNMSEYHPFINLFNSVVNNNVKLSQCDKLYYLNSFLEGEALDVIKHLPLNGESYPIALDLLKQRYDNKARLITHHVNQILDFPMVNRCTSVTLRNLISNVKQHLGALKYLEQPTQQWDSLLVCILQRKLDQYTIRSFYLEMQSTSIMPTLESLFEFIERKAAALESSAQTSAQVCSPQHNERPRRASLASSVVANNVEKHKKIKCKYCTSQLHRLYVCPKFKLSSSSERNEFMNKNKSFCIVCLNEHDGKCRFNFKCAVCKAPHNTLLHHDNSANTSDGTHQESPELVSTNRVGLFCSQEREVILPTVEVQVRTANGSLLKTRALLDSGSQVSFVLSSLVDELQCVKHIKDNTVMGICNGKNEIKEMAKFTINSCINDFKQEVNCCIVKKITEDMPQFHIPRESLNIPKDIALADTNFDKTSPITILLGCDVFFQALLHHVRPLSLNGPLLVNTRFGHVVAGAIPTQQASINKTSLFAINKVSQSQSFFEHDSTQLDMNLKQFWEAEKVPEVFSEMGTEQELAEISFKESVVLKDCKFQVALPLKQSITKLQLGDSFSSALQRFLNLERRLLKDKELYEKYKQFITEYIELGHAELYDISNYNFNTDAVYFLPHHPVFNEQSTTTKMRTVFDGSMLTKNKISLNDVLLNGPIVQRDLFDILIQFRFPKYVLIADIKQMFRMILIDPKYRSLQNILWRENVDSSISCVQLKTVTYGLKSSSFLATRCLLELAERFKDDFPLAAEVLRHQTYVDDIHTGHDDIVVLLKIKEQLIQLLRLGGFELHKWSTNNKQVLSDIPKEKLSLNPSVDLNKGDMYVKTLGLKYNVSSDKLFIRCPETVVQEKYTRRQVLSFISKFYDPLGLVGPLFVFSKIILQKICQLHLSWDDELPSDINEEWRSFAKDLITMSCISINRHIDMRQALRTEVIGYADASNRAYGCAVYLRVINNNGSVSVYLLCSKSRICPINKDLSTPRLELNSALLLAMLVNKLYGILRVRYDLDVYLYLDSMIVLGWLAIEPIKLQAYVANRVKKITELTSSFTWLYVPTNQNPGDCISRGVQPHLLQENILWWQGPRDLLDKDFIHVKPNVKVQTNLLPELKNEKVKTCNVSSIVNEFNFMTKYSNLDTVVRVMAYILRFYKNCKTIKENRNFESFSPTELENALNIIIKLDQHQHYAAEISCIRAKEPVKGSLSSLNCFLDKNELLRVGGRLQNAGLTYSETHPIILVKGSTITKLIIMKAHRQLLHTSQKGILCYLNQKYWLIDALRDIKNVIYKCIICFKLKAKNATQLMGTLPKERVRVARPFEKVGIDYAGPFNIKFARVRKPVHYKSYVLIFVCFVTKAIHIELASDMTTDNFLNCLKRFIARRNKPSQIFCDNAGTFRSANTQLQELYKLQSSTDHRNSVNQYIADLGIEFKFVPAYSPVFAGLWEAGVKSIKYHIKRVVANNVLTYEEFNTVLIQIEAILNSRPLTKMSSDSNDMSYLSPAHFLTGAPLTCYPEPDLKNTPVNRLSFWRLCTQIQQHFFSQWSKQYLTMLQNRPKWKSDVPNLAVGTLVILKTENMSPLKWPMARIVNVYPGSDNKVRAIDVLTPTGHVMRTSVMKVCPLPIDD